MNKLTISAILAGLLLLPIISAEDEELFIPYVGDEEFYIGRYVGDEELGMFFYSPAPAAEVVIVGGGGGSAAYMKRMIISTPYYDVLLEGLRDSYDIDAIIKVDIIIINKGDIPDRDANLTYYLKGPEGNIYAESRETFEEIPPTCPEAEYYIEQDKCVKEDGTSFEPLKTILKRNVPLPLNTTEGNWKFYVEYETEIQSPIQVYKTFRVKEVDYTQMILIGLVAFYLLFIYKPKR